MDPRKLRGAAAVVGVGTTAYGRFPGYTADDLGGWALRAALDDAGLSARDLDGLLTVRVSGCQAIAAAYGIEPAWVAELPANGRMASAAIALATTAIDAGLCHTVALVYGNDGRSAGATYGGRGEGYGLSPQLAAPYGLTSPGAFYALMFQRHAHLYGTTSDQLATVALTLREHARRNPQALMRAPLTRADYHASRYVVEPLHLFDYCLINDGGVALILTSAERAAACARPPVDVLGFAQAGQFLVSDLPPDDFWWAALQRVADRAWSMAGVGRADVDVLQVYDNFSPNVLFALEGLGFAPRGEGGAWISDGRIAIGGELPVNTSGGHLSESYMQGWGQNAEAVRQLRGDGGARQVDGAEVAQYVCSAPLVSTVLYGRRR